MVEHTGPLCFDRVISRVQDAMLGVDQNGAGSDGRNDDEKRGEMDKDHADSESASVGVVGVLSKSWVTNPPSWVTSLLYSPSDPRHSISTCALLEVYKYK